MSVSEPDLACCKCGAEGVRLTAGFCDGCRDDHEHPSTPPKWVDLFGIDPDWPTGPDIHEAFALAGLTPTRGRWGQLQASLDGDRTVVVCEDDGALHVLLFTGGTAMVGAGGVRISGRFAKSTFPLAAILTAVSGMTSHRRSAYPQLEVYARGATDGRR